jgi:hypothetical protein
MLHPEKCTILFLFLNVVMPGELNCCYVKINLSFLKICIAGEDGRNLVFLHWDRHRSSSHPRDWSCSCPPSLGPKSVECAVCVIDEYDILTHLQKIS